MCLVDIIQFLIFHLSLWDLIHKCSLLSLGGGGRVGLETGSHPGTLVGLEHAMLSRLAWNSEIYLPHVGITGLYYPA